MPEARGGLEIVRASALGELRPPGEVGLVRPRIDAAFVQPSSGDLQVHGPSDRTRHIGLERQHVDHVALVALAPQVTVGACVDELSRDAHAITRA